MFEQPAIILFFLFVALQATATTPGMVAKKPCHCAKTLLHRHCMADSVARPKLPPVKKADVPAKKDSKEEAKSVFAKIFSVDFSTTQAEDFFLSAQKALIEKFF